MITKIELNPKDIEQEGDMNSNCDWDCDQVIGFGEILTELLKLDLLDGPNTNENTNTNTNTNRSDCIGEILTELLKLDLLDGPNTNKKDKYKYKYKWLDWWDFDWIIEVGFVGGSKYK